MGFAVLIHHALILLNVSTLPWYFSDSIEFGFCWESGFAVLTKLADAFQFD